MRILILDDDGSGLDLPESTSEKGWEVTTCADHSSVIPVVQEVRPDLLVVNVSMRSPQTTWTWLDEARRSGAACDIPLVVCSADRYGLQDQQTWLDTHAAAVLVKPYSADDFTLAVERALSVGSESAH